MTEPSSILTSVNQTHRLIRETLEQYSDKLIDKIAESLKREATLAYQKMDLAALRQIAQGALFQTACWMEACSGQIIENDLSEGLTQRLKLGFTIADFTSTTDLVEREIKEFYREVFEDRPDLIQRSMVRLDGIYTIVRTVEARMVMRHHKNKE